MKSPKKKKAVRRRAITPEDREFGRKIAGLRKAANITQEEAANIFGVSEAQYGKYERAETPMLASLFFRIKKYFRDILDNAASGGGFREAQAPFQASHASTAETSLRTKLAAIRRALEDLEVYIHDNKIRS
ncbi:MAG: helix-turn-helix transcriptional regulator [Mesorhizobium sp.]|nr:helix-turn-helix transcriptional regulator [Mesorhizobium sp.]MBL8576111.1 helix-turn-helix transcriptional regulator [Mesorhizobium sp.]